MSNIIFRRQGNAFFPSTGAASEHTELPPGTYTLCQPPMSGMHMHVSEDLGAPGKLYGDIEERARHVVKTFRAREGVTTGVLLSGPAGTGKTLLAKRIAELCRTQHKIPTLVVNEPFGGTGFSQFMADIKQPAVVFVDEFEKVYCEKEHQHQLLTLLDGAYSSHKLFIFVVNDTENIIETLTDRPGRIMYHWSYARLPHDVIVSYAQENLKNQDHLPGLLIAMDLAVTCSFDILKALIWEMNQYSVKAGAALVNLNMRITNTLPARVQISGMGENSGKNWKTTTSWSPMEKKLDFLVSRQPSEDSGDDSPTRITFTSMPATPSQMWRRTQEQQKEMAVKAARKLQNSAVSGGHVPMPPGMRGSSESGRSLPVHQLSTFVPLPGVSPYSAPTHPFNPNPSAEEMVELQQAFFEKNMLVVAEASQIVSEDYIEGVVEYQTPEFFIRLELVRTDSIQKQKAMQVLPF